MEHIVKHFYNQFKIMNLTPAEFLNGIIHRQVLELHYHF